MNQDKRQTIATNKENLKDLYSLTPMQEGMLFHSLYDESPGTFVEQISCLITGDFNISLFEKSWNELFKQNDIFRTILIPQKAAQPLQMVLRECQVDFHYENIQHLNGKQQEDFWKNYQEEDRKKGFKLDRDLLMRVAVFQTDSDSYEVLWTHHHILMDGWSSGLVLGQLIDTYKALVDGKSPKSSSIAPPYSYFIRWLKQQNTEAAKVYWKQYLQDYNYPVKMPISQSPKVGYKLSTFAFKLEEETTSQLEQLARKYQVTLNSLVQSIWAVLLTHYHDVDDVVFGSTVSGRPPEIKGIEQMLGLFINTIPVRVRLEGQLTFAQLIEQIQKDAIASIEHSYYSLADIQALSEHRSSLLDHVIVFQNYPAHDRVREAIETVDYGFSIEKVQVIEQSNYDFSVVVTPGAQLQLRFLYNAKVFSLAYLQRLESHLENIIKTVLKSPEIAIADIQILSDRESHLLLSEFNATKVVYDRSKTIVDLIEQQANQTPDATAVSFADKKLSYQELCTTSSQIAAYLVKQLQVQRGEPIAILLSPSEQFVIAVLAVMKAGCGFMTLDPKAPIERNLAIINESGAKVAIGDRVFSPKLENFSGTVVVIENQDALDKEAREQGAVSSGSRRVREPLANKWGIGTHVQPAIPRQGEEDISPCSLPPSPSLFVEPLSTNYLPSPADLAYIIFTSGSTGKPKGIAVNHYSLFNYICWCSKFYFRGRDMGNMPLFTSPAFDLTITSLFCPLVVGKTVVVTDREEIDQTLRQIIDLGNQIDTIKLTPSHISALKQLEPKQTGIQLAIVGGEKLKKEQVETLLALNPSMEIYNEYGPAEATVGCIVSRVVEPDCITIGKPIDNTRIYILNRHLSPVPIGCVGEIYIAGSCLADGYWQNSTLSTAKFIQHPLEPKSKLYQSGDLGKWLENGEIIYLGRKDDQVKIRGHRVELGEVESMLKQHPGVEDAVVIVSEDREEEGELRGYIIPDFSQAALIRPLVKLIPEDGNQGESQTFNLSDTSTKSQGEEADERSLQVEILVKSIRSFLGNQLPEYLIPKDFQFVDQFPLTHNGKLDRKALLQETGLTQKQNQAYELPKGSIETILAGIWQDLLGIKTVGVYDDFFALGGHSLKALMLLSRIRKSLGVEIALKSVFEFSTIRALGDYIATIGTYNDFIGKEQMILLSNEHKRYIFALPTVLGYGIAFKGLAQHLKSYSVYGLDFIEDKDPVARYAEFLEKAQPEGSYVLLGYCAGGNLAFELAKGLEHRDRQVSDIIMLDSIPRFCQRNESEAMIQEQVEAEIGYYSTFVREDKDLSLLLSNPYFQDKLKAKMIAYMRYLNNVVNDGQITANIHLICSQENQPLPNNLDSWVKITTGKVSIYNGCGNHGDMLVNEYLQYNASVMNEILEQILQNQQASN